VAHEEEEAGYKRPPKSGQFKPGQSGNPRGRPKGSANFKADLAAEMRELITLRDRNGRPQKVTKQRAFIKLLFSSALQNEKSAITALLACMRYFGAGSEEPVTETADLEDLDMIKDYVERTEMRLRHAKDPSNEPNAPKRKTRK
jgi:Family of unknown function (DUF5681)